MTLIITTDEFARRARSLFEEENEVHQFHGVKYTGSDGMKMYGVALAEEENPDQSDHHLLVFRYVALSKYDESDDQIKTNGLNERVKSDAMEREIEDWQRLLNRAKNNQTGATTDDEPLVVGVGRRED